MPYALANGVRLYYELHGAGPPLVLLSGLGGDHTFWQASVPRLAGQFRVLVVDLRGSGHSDAPDAPCSIELLADDLAALLDALRLSRAHVLGFSMGGAVALTLALRHPGRVARLVLAATFAAMSPQVRLFLDAVLDVYEGGVTPRQMFGLIAPWLFSEEFISRPANAVWLRYADDELPQPLYAWRHHYLAQRQFDAVAQLPAVQAPTLVLAGGQDRLAPLAAGRLLARRLPGARLHLLPRAGHLLNHEAPEAFHRALLDFLCQPMAASA